MSGQNVAGDPETELCRLPTLPSLLIGFPCVVAGPGKTLLNWATASGLVRSELRGHKEAVTAVVFNRDGDLAMTGSSDRTAIIWDVKKGERRR